MKEESINKKSRKFWRYAIGVVLVMVIASMSGCPVFYISSSVDGRIVDEETGKPIANAYVVGIWELEGGWVDTNYLGPVHFEETKTDAQGRYHLDGFWFRLVWPFIFFAHLGNDDPVVYVFADGYKPRGWTANAYTQKLRAGFYRRSPLNGKDIPLNPMGKVILNEADDWHWSVRFMKAKLQRCDLRKLPEIVEYIKQMESRFQQAGYKFTMIYESEFEDCR